VRNVAVDVQVSHKNLSERVLKLTVCDIDRLRRHNVIGSVVFPLRGREDDVTAHKLFTSLRLEHADAVIDAVSSTEVHAECRILLKTLLELKAELLKYNTRILKHRIITVANGYFITFV